MFGGAANPYDEIIVKATDENLASEDWALNIEVCDKVTGDGANGARNAVASLQKRLSHRNPNVQLYALELANTLAQNCGKPMMVELASRNWTQALDRLVNDRATSAPVKKKALGYIKSWAKQFEEAGDSNLGLMGELYDQLRAKNHTFDEPEPVPEDRARTRQEAEDDELQRVLELSKQDRGGRNQPGFGGGSASSSAPPPQAQPQPQRSLPKPQQFSASPAPAAPPREPTPPPLDINSATRVRALYTFSSNEVGELNFERGDMIKVLDRGFQEWWRGACNGKIGIFPVTYVEPLPEPTTAELQREAQEEAQVFASLGLVDQLLQTLKEIDPARGDRLDDKPEVEAMYQDSVKLQGQINALIKKYSDQKAELEHMNANFNRAMRQYEEMRTAPPPMPQQYGYVPPAPAPGYDQQYPQQQQPPQMHPQHSQGQVPQQPYPVQGQQGPPAPEYQATPFPQANPAHPPHHASDGGAPGQPFYAQHQNVSRPGIDRIPSGAPSYPPNEPHRQATEPGAAGMGAADQSAAWEAYYRQQAEQGHVPPQQQGQGQGEYPVEYGVSPYPPQEIQHQQQGGQRSSSYGHGPAPGQGQGQGSVDSVSQQMGGMRVHGQ